MKLKAKSHYQKKKNKFEISQEPKKENRLAKELFNLELKIVVTMIPTDVNSTILSKFEQITGKADNLNIIDTSLT